MVIRRGELFSGIIVAGNINNYKIHMGANSSCNQRVDEHCEKYFALQATGRQDNAAANTPARHAHKHRRNLLGKNQELQFALFLGLSKACQPAHWPVRGERKRQILSYKNIPDAGAHPMEGKCPYP